MLTRSLTLIVASMVVAHASAAVAPVRTMYEDALAKEQAVRRALADPAATDVLLKAVREVVAGYDAVVRRYPASSYSDDALWNAGRLELDAFARFRQQADQDVAARLFARLAAAYPTSKFVKQIPADLRRATAALLPAASPPPASPPAARDVVERSVASAPAEKTGPPAVIRDIRRSRLPDGVRVTIELNAEVQYHDERIADPDRVFIDLPSTRAAQPLVDRTIRFDGDNDVIRQIRVGLHPHNTTRVVLDAAGVSSYSVYPLYGPFRLVIDCIRATDVAVRPAVAPAPGPPVLAARRLGSELARLPSPFPRAAVLIAEARLELFLPPVLPSAALPPAPAVPIDGAALPVPASAAPLKAFGGVTMARQLGLGVSRIVIDAGHGGHDPGAKGKGVTEAEVVLDVALRLEKLLLTVPGVEVIQTRRTDDFIPLPERTAIANREGADLFLSIHANASPSLQARGIETYFLNFATNLSAAGVASRENAASGQAMGALPDLVKAIALNNKLDESRDFASQVQRSMMTTLNGPNKTIKNLGVKQAPFVVLIGAAMPSVLAEISFVTNPQEARLLKSTAYRQKIAEALFAAIQKYQTSLRRVQAVAPE